MILRAGISLLLCLAAVSLVTAQTEGELKPVLGMAHTCEEAKALLDLTRNDVGNEGVIVLVARLGDREVSRRLNRQRLFNVWSYLHHAGGFPANRLVKAEGDRVRGFGRMELYAKGRLMLILPAKRQGDIVGVRSCGPV
jgi:hypothetical protein